MEAQKDGVVDEKISKPMDWDRTIFNQVDRTNLAMTQGSPDFPRAVETLKTLLVFFQVKDEVFKRAIVKIETDTTAYKAVNTSPVTKEVPPDQLEQVTWWRANQIYEQCLLLIGRAGFYPERQRDFEER